MWCVFANSIRIGQNYEQLKEQAGAEFGQAQQLDFKFGLCLVFAVKDRLSLRYGSVRN